MMTSRAANQSSQLLSYDDNNLLFQVIGSRCESLATAVIQLFLTSPPNHDRWIKKNSGVLCFIKDQSRRSYFFRVYCLQRKCLIWEQELYEMINYQTYKDFLHFFEAENCICAFNFASVEESTIFKTAVISKLEMRKHNKGVNRNRKSKDLNQHNVSTLSSTTFKSDQSATQTNVQNNYATINNCNFSSSFPNISKLSKSTFSRKMPKKRLNKNEISTPTDFRHISYVTLNRDGTITTNVNNPILATFFNKAGVSQHDLNDTKTRDFIYQFIDNYGGMDAVKKEISEDNILDPKNNSDHSNLEKNTAPPPPPVPARNFNTKNPLSIRQTPPSPNRTLKHQNLLKDSTQPQHRKVFRNGVPLPSPPPPPQSLSTSTTTVPSVPVLHSTSKEIPKTNISLLPPPPPPPPLPPITSIPTINNDKDKSVSVESDINGVNMDSRAALLDSIKSGVALKHVEMVKKSTDSPRATLLNEIRQGIELKSVQTNEKSFISEGDGLAAALARALAERARVIRSDSESDSSTLSDDSDDDEWDD